MSSTRRHNERAVDSLQLSADLAGLPKFIAFAVDWAQKAGFTPKRIQEIELVLEEALVNVMEYAYPGQSGMLTLLAINEAPQRLVLEIRDQGELFNPLAREDPDVRLELRERPVGGLGIFLMKQLADGLSWQRKGSENCLTLLFKERRDA